ncbi:11193_t:CDS:2 [Diversispora eburnea]|uniref:11193_t:CDS:1 n=1 Tax=Diversispora eburnea TaxID=1213867 RepID=A0A9N9ASP9_9GLOM|nr:11193_t:CDS:2 [Diversispora eburnea]
MGQLILNHDILLNIIQFLNDENDYFNLPSLYKLLFVDRFFCRNLIPFLYKRFFDYTLIQSKLSSKRIRTILSCLSEKEKWNLNNILPDLPYKCKPLFNYATYIEYICIEELLETIADWLEYEIGYKNRNTKEFNLQVKSVSTSIWRLLIRKDIKILQFKTIKRNLASFNRTNFMIKSQNRSVFRQLRYLDIFNPITFEHFKKFFFHHNNNKVVCTTIRKISWLVDASPDSVYMLINIIQKQRNLDSLSIFNSRDSEDFQKISRTLIDTQSNNLTKLEFNKKLSLNYNDWSQTSKGLFDKEIILKTSQSLESIEYLTRKLEPYHFSLVYAIKRCKNVKELTFNIRNQEEINMLKMVVTSSKLKRLNLIIRLGNELMKNFDEQLIKILPKSLIQLECVVQQNVIKDFFKLCKNISLIQFSFQLGHQILNTREPLSHEFLHDIVEYFKRKSSLKTLKLNSEIMNRWKFLKCDLSALDELKKLEPRAFNSSDLKAKEQENHFCETLSDAWTDLAIGKNYQEK